MAAMLGGRASKRIQKVGIEFANMQVVVLSKIWLRVLLGAWKVSGGGVQWRSNIGSNEWYSVARIFYWGAGHYIWRGAVYTKNTIYRWLSYGFSGSGVPHSRSCASPRIQQWSYLLKYTCRWLVSCSDRKIHSTVHSFNDVIRHRKRASTRQRNLHSKWSKKSEEYQVCIPRRHGLNARFVLKLHSTYSTGIISARKKCTGTSTITAENCCLLCGTENSI